MTFFPDLNKFAKFCDIYISYQTFGTKLGTMFTAARQTSQGTQRCYTACQIPEEPSNNLNINDFDDDYGNYNAFTPRINRNFNAVNFFDQSIDNLPANLEYLYLGWEFNHHLHYLPPNLLILDISKCKMTNLFDLSNINQNTTIIKSVPNSTSSSLFNVINESDITKGIIHCLYITLKNYFYNVILLQNHRYKIIFRNNLIILAGYFTYKYLINIITKEWDNH
jgi:hypothetical protein